MSGNWVTSNLLQCQKFLALLPNRTQLGFGYEYKAVGAQAGRSVAGDTVFDAWHFIGYFCMFGSMPKHGIQTKKRNPTKPYRAVIWDGAKRVYPLLTANGSRAYAIYTLTRS